MIVANSSSIQTYLLSWLEYKKKNCRIRKENSKSFGGDVGADYMQVVRNGQCLPLAIRSRFPKLGTGERPVLGSGDWPVCPQAAAQTLVLSALERAANDCEPDVQIES